MSCNFSRSTQHTIDAQVEGVLRRPVEAAVESGHRPLIILIDELVSEH